MRDHLTSKRTATIAWQAVPVLAAGLLLLSQSAHANPYSAALSARHYEEAERAANAALAARQGDPLALAAKVDVIVATAPQARGDEAVDLAEQCVAAHPRQSACQEALGNALGIKALNADALAAMKYARRIRDAFRRAVELDPANLSARFALLQYYLAAPGVVGGGVNKARSLVAGTAKLNADAGQLMQALVDANRGDPVEAERLVRATNVATDDALSEPRRDVLWAIGESYISAKRFADAERVFRYLQSLYPSSELGPLGLALSLQDQGKHAEAIPLFENALKIYPRALIYYRLGQSLQATGAKASALDAYEKALAVAPGLPRKQRADAADRIKSLKE